MIEARKVAREVAEPTAARTAEEMINQLRMNEEGGDYGAAAAEDSGDGS